MGLPVLVGDRHSGNIAGASLERSERNDDCCGTVPLRSTSASTQVVESRWRSVTRFRCSWSQLLIRHLIGAPSPSYFKKNSNVTFGKSRSRDETCKVFTRSMVAFSVLLLYGCCAQTEQLQSTSIKLDILRISVY